MQSFIKYLGIIICCIYFYMKLLHLSATRKMRISFFLFAITLSVLSVYTNRYFPYAGIPILCLLFIAFFTCQTKESFPVVVTATTLSFALSYILFTFSALAGATITFALPEKFIHDFIQPLCFTLQLLLMPIPFRFKRMKKGMPFLRKPVYSIPGTIISIIALLSAILLSNGTYDIIYLIPIILLIIMGILIYFYWKNNLTKTYIDKLNQKNIESLNADLLEKQQYIEELETDNRQLSKMIHKDNKLIPAMEYAVQKYIHDSNLSAENAQVGEELLKELERLAEDRKGMVIHQDKQCEKLPSSKVTGIDNLLHYMQQKAIDAGITFHVTLDCDIPDFVTNIMEENTLYTLLADLLENAIIATKYNNGRHILLNIGMVSKDYAIHVFDSGIPFTKEVLAALGQEQITTHADDSGSGIGMMQTYEILQQYGASLFIDEFTPDMGLYTKKVSVVFNKRHQYTLYTTRDKQELGYLSQRTDLNIVEK